MPDALFAYHRHLLDHLPALLRDDNSRQRLLTFGAEQFNALALLDLEPARTRLRAGYSERRGGARPRDPVMMLRGLIIMSMCRTTRINAFVRRLKGEPELRVLCGLLPTEKAPGVGTFYDFLWRLVDGPHRPACAHQVRASKRLIGRRFERALAVEKDADKAKTQAELAHSQQGRIAMLAQKAIAALDEGLPDDLTQRLHEILLHCAVLPSARLGFLGDLRRLVVAGDGTAVPSHANGFGHAICSCFRDTGTRCDCPRHYSDPEATWGWDSHEERYLFGYRLHVVSTRGDGDDLPVHLSIGGAHTPDAVLGVEALCRLHKQLSRVHAGAHIRAAVFDAGYDAAPFYKLNRHLGIAPVIALAREVKTPASADGTPRDDEGRPLCPANLPMRLHQRSADALLYNCPVKRPGRRDGKYIYKVHPDECPNKVLCEPQSTLGPLVRLRLDGDPRFDLPIPRGSTDFKILYNDRTCTERFNSTLMSKGDFDSGAFRRAPFVLTFAVAHAIELHARAWASRRFGEANKTSPEQTLDWLRSLVEPAAA